MRCRHLQAGADGGWSKGGDMKQGGPADNHAGPNGGWSKGGDAKMGPDMHGGAMPADKGAGPNGGWSKGGDAKMGPDMHGGAMPADKGAGGGWAQGGGPDMGKGKVRILHVLGLPFLSPSQALTLQGLLIKCVSSAACFTATGYTAFTRSCDRGRDDCASACRMAATEC